MLLWVNGLQNNKLKLQDTFGFVSVEYQEHRAFHLAAQPNH